MAVRNIHRGVLIESSDDGALRVKEMEFGRVSRLLRNFRANVTFKRRGEERVVWS